MIFQAGNVYESASLFNLEENKIDAKDGRIRTHDPNGLVYYAYHWTTEDLLDRNEIIKVHIASTPTPKTNLTSFKQCLTLISKGSV